MITTGMARLLGVGLLFCSLGTSARVEAAEIRVMISGGFMEAYRQVLPGFEAQTGHRVITIGGASMGNAPDSIPVRLARGEAADIVILAESGVETLIKEGRVVPGSRVDLARSIIGMAVRAGAPKPDISTVEALRRTLLEAKSVGYSASASGVYLSTEMFKALGVEEQMRVTGRRIVSERVGAVVARGEVEIGFQQVSELVPIPGLDYVGPLPAPLQRVTIFSAGLSATAQEPEAARALIAYLSGPAAGPVLAKLGLERPGPR